MVYITAEQFRAVSVRILKAAGRSDADAFAATESRLWATLRGNNHGFESFSQLVRSISVQGDKSGALQIVKETPSTVVIDGNWCEGATATLLGTDMIIEKAKTVGIAAATMFRCGTNGALGFYTNRIADHDMAGIAFSGAVAASPPYGGAQRMLGTNPLSFCVPAGEEFPVLVDWATSAASWGGLSKMVSGGDPLPEGVILDDDGLPTTNVTEITASSRARNGEEVHGSLDNFASNHKGYSIQFVVEMLGEILPALKTGNEVSTSVGNPVFHNPSFIIAVNISFFQDLEAFKRKMDARIREIRSSRKNPHTEDIYLPGERGFRTREERLLKGIPVPDNFWTDVTHLADSMQVDISDLLADAEASRAEPT